jgi:hypothetical protein
LDSALFDNHRRLGRRGCHQHYFEPDHRQFPAAHRFAIQSQGQPIAVAQAQFNVAVTGVNEE